VSEIPEEAYAAAAEALAVHRWKSMGVASAECECGAILYGDADPFPADEAFRTHLAGQILEAAWPGFLAGFSERTAGMAEALKRAEAIIGERDRQLAAARAEERERLFVAIRHKIPLSQPWRGEALDLIWEVWRETDG
jgi:hypothetical protein